MTLDTNTIPNIKAECLSLANDDMIRSEHMTPAWGQAACAVADYLVTCPEDELDKTGPKLWEVMELAVPGISKEDSFHAVMIMAGWPNLLEMTFYYRLDDGSEIELDYDLVRKHDKGDPRHPVTGMPDPDFGKRTFVYYRGTDKLAMLRRFDPSRPVATRGGHPARVLCTNRDSRDGFVIVALYDDGSGEGVIHTRLDGTHRPDGEPCDLDLVNVPEPLPMAYYPLPKITIDLSQRVCTMDSGEHGFFAPTAVTGPCPSLPSGAGASGTRSMSSHAAPTAPATSFPTTSTNGRMAETR